MPEMNVDVNFPFCFSFKKPFDVRNRLWKSLIVSSNSSSANSPTNINNNSKEYPHLDNRSSPKSGPAEVRRAQTTSNTINSMKITVSTTGRIHSYYCPANILTISHWFWCCCVGLLPHSLFSLFLPFRNSRTLLFQMRYHAKDNLQTMHPIL